MNDREMLESKLRDARRQIEYWRYWAVSGAAIAAILALAVLTGALRTDAGAGQSATAPISPLVNVVEPLPAPPDAVTMMITATLAPTLTQHISTFLPYVAKARTIHVPLVFGRTSSVLLSSVRPLHGAAGQSPNTYLAWQWDFPDAAQARYTLYLEANDETPDTLVAWNLARTNFDPATLALDTVYYWRVVTTDAAGHMVFGPTWSFRTEPLLNPPAVGAMVRVPAGEFMMGCDRQNTGGFPCLDKEVPLHPVWLETFDIDKYEVTNGEYRACVAAGVCNAPLRTSSYQRDRYYGYSHYNDFPVLYVSWWDAQDYCGWVGKRLPTEAEWEKAARGPIDTRVFPWGNEFPDCGRINRIHLEGDIIQCEDDTTKVGSLPYGASPYGAMDMAGNVFEWVQDYFLPSYYRFSPYYNPINTVQPSELLFVIRGGSYRDNIHYLRTTHRHFGHWGPTEPNEDPPFHRSSRLGFRCARPVIGE